MDGLFGRGMDHDTPGTIEIFDVELEAAVAVGN